jgi:hypothetical protein
MPSPFQISIIAVSKSARASVWRPERDLEGVALLRFGPGEGGFRGALRRVRRDRLAG